MSASSEVTLPRDFNVDRLSFGEPKKQPTGAKTIFISYGGKPLYLQTPSMKAPFGISVWPSDNGGPDKYSLDLSFEGYDSNPAIQTWFELIKAIDKRLVNEAMDKSMLWFMKKHPSIDVVNALYTPTVKFGKDKTTGEVSTRYAPTFKMSLPFKDGKFLFPAFSGNRTELDIAEIIQTGRSKGARVQAIVQLSAVWIVGSKFGLMWKVRQLRLSEAARLGSTYAFQPTGDEGEEEDEEQQNAGEDEADDDDDVPPQVARSSKAAAGKAAVKKSAAAGGSGSKSAGGKRNGKGGDYVDETDDDEEDAQNTKEHEEADVDL